MRNAKNAEERINRNWLKFVQSQKQCWHFDVVIGNMVRYLLTEVCYLTEVYYHASSMDSTVSLWRASPGPGRASDESHVAPEYRPRNLERDK